MHIVYSIDFICIVFCHINNFIRIVIHYSSGCKAIASFWVTCITTWD